MGQQGYLTMRVTLVLLYSVPVVARAQLPNAPVKVSVYLPLGVFPLVAIKAVLCSIPHGFSQKDLG